jgi:hypothetical protein
MMRKATLQSSQAMMFGGMMFMLAIGCLPALSQATKPVMANIAPYLMERNEEISLARSAAPESISRDADVLVLGAHGYETAIKGSNGFVCEVDRAWTSGFTDPEFMHADVREPICFNAVAARSMLPWTLKRLALAMGGASKDEMIAQIKSAYAKNELPLPESGAMSYMMSKRANFGKSYGQGMAHLMFYFPSADAVSWGADLPGSPVILHEFDAEPVKVFFIHTKKWSDGTEDPVSMK